MGDKLKRISIDLLEKQLKDCEMSDREMTTLRERVYSGRMMSSYQKAYSRQNISVNAPTVVCERVAKGRKNDSIFGPARIFF